MRLRFLYCWLVLSPFVAFPLFQTAVALDLDPQRGAAHYSPAGSAEAVAVDGDVAFIAGGLGGLQVIDISDPWHPRPLSSVQTGGYATDVAVQNDLALLVHGSPVNIFSPQTGAVNGLVAIDISDPRNPRVTRHLEFPGAVAQAVASSGDLAVVALGESGMRTIDIKDLAFNVVGGYESDGFSRDVAISGRYALVAVERQNGGELLVIDVSDPSDPRPIGAYQAATTIQRVVAQDDVALIVEDRNLAILDLSNPAQPSLINKYDRMWPVDFSIVGHFAYITDHLGALHILDLEDITAPRLVGGHRFTGLTTSWSGGVAATDGRVIVASADSKLTIIDASAPESPGHWGATAASEVPWTWRCSRISR